MTCKSHQHRLSPIVRVHLQLIQPFSTSSIKDVHDTMVTTTDNDAAVLCEGDLTGPLRFRNRDMECTNSSPRFKPIKGNALSGLVNAENSSFRIDCSIATDCTSSDIL
jgi:hypothetical protein